MAASVSAPPNPPSLSSLSITNSSGRSQLLHQPTSHFNDKTYYEHAPAQSVSGPSRPCLPPKPHSDSIIMAPPLSTIPQAESRKRKLPPPAAESPSPAPSTPTSSNAADADEDEYDPSHPSGSRTSARGGAKRVSGNKPHPPSTASKAAGGRALSREALRKANHSLIERRRREKINAALGDLRSMIPGLGEAGGGKGGEFKLEVLERTVEHMRDLKQQIVELEARLASNSTIRKIRTKSHLPVVFSSRDASEEEMDNVQPRPRKSKSDQSGCKSTSTPPTPSVSPHEHHQSIFSPDPNETEVESNLPPPLALAASRSSEETRLTGTGAPRIGSPQQAPSISSLLASAQTMQRHNQALPSRTPAPPQANNPTLYLPFPTPSPTSPFLTYPSAPSCSGTSFTGPPEPSPFLAPLQNMSLFGGALNLDQPVGGKDGNGNAKQPDPSMAAEEAANLLLAFSSPDAMRPVNFGNVTPMMAAVTCRERRSTLESEEFTLDDGVVGQGASGGVREDVRMVTGKTASDILKM